MSRNALAGILRELLNGGEISIWRAIWRTESPDAFNFAVLLDDHGIIFHSVPTAHPTVCSCPVRALGDTTLRKIARELTDKLRASNSVDWYVRDSVRAKLRLMVKATLKKWKYPPDGQDRATEAVLEQAAALSEA
jgi:hypothetical protein